MDLFHVWVEGKTYPGRALISFDVFLIIKTVFLRFRILTHISALLVLAIIKIQVKFYLWGGAYAH